MAERPPLWAVSAEFTAAGPLIDAVAALRPLDLGRLDTFTPVPVPEVIEVVDPHRGPLREVGVAAAVLGGTAMMAMCVYASGYAYVFLIGGRPKVSWPSFVIPSVSFAMLAGSLAVFLAMMVLNRLPRLNHPAFNIPGIGRASQDRFFLAIEARDDQFDADAVERALGRLPHQPLRVARVPR